MLKLGSYKHQHIVPSLFHLHFSLRTHSLALRTYTSDSFFSVPFFFFIMVSTRGVEHRGWGVIFGPNLARKTEMWEVGGCERL